MSSIDLVHWGGRDRLANIEQQLSASQLTGTRPYVGAADPGPSMPSGTEYVWFQTDGVGTLLDILVGVA